MTRDLDWLARAETQIGVKEYKGAASNPVIVGWGKLAGIDWYRKDSDAWCAVFVNAMLVEAGYPSTKSALARSFTRYGTRLSKVVPGAIVVFPRTRNPLYGHVGIVKSVNRNGTITIVNGNVSDMVKESVYRIDAILPNGIRWPPGAPMPSTTRQVAMGPAREYELGDRLLVRGSRGDDVEELQRILDDLGYMSNDEDVSSFGPTTEDAVRAFQRKSGLLIDGKVGQATTAALKAVRGRKARRDETTDTAVKSAVPALGVGAIGAAGIGEVVSVGHQVKSFAPSEMIAAGIGLAVIVVICFVLYRKFTKRRRSEEMFG